MNYIHLIHNVIYNLVCLGNITVCELSIAHLTIFYED